MALSNPALPVRQNGTYLAGAQRAYTALAYYDNALRISTAALRTPSSSAIFDSCLLLAHCEKIDASNQDWRLHLYGAYSLVSAQGWHGRSGGLVQACFWIYCRMDVLSSLATYLGELCRAAAAGSLATCSAGYGVRWSRITVYWNNDISSQRRLHRTSGDNRGSSDRWPTCSQRIQKLHSRVTITCPRLSVRAAVQSR
ncbi:hypothetical protein FN846DRAFT_970217 [Sphaerosporella brunnea]|uniref:Uncharacterized protein n=1 Tax=Sphaerosporella brunnea TaxID=1250544 RepID=A0A5J5EHU6_9PEZI|nr:hypothetical protein FN846DRAFT_970217 [Sphaerosporella brunnea]